MGIINMVYGGGGGGGGSSLKSYNEITAMTLANALTELNSQAADYCTKFIDEEKMIADKYLSNDTNSCLFLWSDYYIQYSGGFWSSVQVGDAEETILCVMMADENGDLCIPVDYAQTANWDVSYDGGTSVHYSQQGNINWEMKIGEGLGANTKHLIEIKPHSSIYGWARAFKFTSYNLWYIPYRVAPLLTGVVVDGGYKGWGSSATGVGEGFRRYQYANCVNLEVIPQTEVLPSGVTTIGGDFRRAQCENCRKLKSIPSTEVMPNTVTSIGNYFRDTQYGGCPSLTTPSTEALSSGVTTLGTYFRNSQYKDCNSLRSASTEVLPSSVTTIGNYFRSRQYSGCISLKVPTAEVLPNTVDTIGTNFRAFQYEKTNISSATPEILSTSITAIPDYYRYYQYSGCLNLTSVAAEVLPNTVTSIGNYFRNNQYYESPLITEPTAEVLPSSVTTIGNYFRSYQYNRCKELIVSADEVLPSSVTTIGNYFRNYQYGECGKLVTAGVEALPNTVTSIGTYFRNYQYVNCTKLAAISGWRDLSIGANYYRSSQFSGCNTNKTVTVLTDVGYAGQSNTLNSSYVTQINVPSAYLNNFKNSTKYPRSPITDSKFVGY